MGNLLKMLKEKRAFGWWGGDFEGVILLQRSRVREHRNVPPHRNLENLLEKTGEEQKCHKYVVKIVKNNFPIEIL